MDGNYNGSNQINYYYCSNCGTNNEVENNFCVSCGSPIKKSNVQFTNNNQVSNYNQNNNSNQNMIIHNNNKKEKEKVSFSTKFLGCVGALVCLLLCYNIPALLYVIFPLAVLSLFFDKTRSFGIVFIIISIICLITLFVFAIILFGMCFAAIGGA